jgi:hypothetical protein
MTEAADFDGGNLVGLRGLAAGAPGRHIPHQAGDGWFFCSLILAAALLFRAESSPCSSTDGDRGRERRPARAALARCRPGPSPAAGSTAVARSCPRPRSAGSPVAAAKNGARARARVVPEGPQLAVDGLRTRRPLSAGLGFVADRPISSEHGIFTNHVRARKLVGATYREAERRGDDGAGAGKRAEIPGD